MRGLQGAPAPGVTRRSGLVAGWRRVTTPHPAAPSPVCLEDPGDVAWQPRLASRQSYGQELACLDNLGMPVLPLTCSCKRSC